MYGGVPRKTDDSCRVFQLSIFLLRALCARFLPRMTASVLGGR